MIVEKGKYKINCDDPRFINDIMENKEYDFMDNDKVIVDLGANIGVFSMWVYDRAKVIYAVEPSEEYVNLDKNVKENELHKIKTFNFAISGQNGSQIMHKNSGTGSWSLKGVINEGNPVATVQTKTLATFFKENNIDYVDLLKIDVEGAEVEIFSAGDFGDIADNIAFIFGEYHNEGNMMVDSLVRHNFDVIQLPSGHFTARKIYAKKS
jgi:FkbM family methyltransferase